MQVSLNLVLIWAQLIMDQHLVQVMDWRRTISQRWIITMTSWWSPWRLKSPASRLFAQFSLRRISKKTSKLRVTGLCAERPATRKMFSFDDVIMNYDHHCYCCFHYHYQNTPSHLLMWMYTFSRADSRFAPRQWETALLCDDVSHWLGANLESALF